MGTVACGLVRGRDWQEAGEMTFKAAQAGNLLRVTDPRSVVDLRHFRGQCRNAPSENPESIYQLSLRLSGLLYNGLCQ